MGIFTFVMDVPCAVSPEKLYKTFVLDADTLIPKLNPQAIKSVEILEGDGGAGTIKLVNFDEGSRYKYAKHRVDAIDKKNLTYSYSIFEGDVLGDAVESISYHVKVVPSADGGSVCRNCTIYTTKEGVELSEDEIKSGEEKTTLLFKAVEAFLLANPDTCYPMYNSFGMNDWSKKLISIALLFFFFFLCILRYFG